MKILLTWIYWCWHFKEIMPWNVGLVSLDELTYEQYNAVTNELFHEWFAEHVKDRTQESQNTEDISGQRQETPKSK